MKQRIEILPQPNIYFYRYNKDNKRRSSMTVEEAVGALMMEEDQDDSKEPRMEGRNDEFSIDEERNDFSD